jgi:hypothetical protein
MITAFCTLQRALQLDARGSSFTNVGGDQHYHIQIINNRDVGPERDRIPTLLTSGMKLVIGATMCIYIIATNISAVRCSVLGFDIT